MSFPTCWRCGRRVYCAIWPRMLCDHCYERIEA